MTDKDYFALPTDAAAARADLDFLKNVVSEGRPFAYSSGLVYAVAGLIYGIQCFVVFADMAIHPFLSPLGHLINGVLPTVLFIALLCVVPLIDRKSPRPKGPVQRGINAAFSGTGLANGVLVAVFAFEAARRQDFSIWLFYAVTVCALQGAVWYGAAILRRRWWMGAVCAGWLLTGLVSGLNIANLPVFVLSLGIGLFAFMAVPGFVLMRLSRPA